MSELHDISNDGSKPQSAALVKKTADSGVVDMLEQEKRHGLAISSEPALPAVNPRPVSGPLTLRPTSGPAFRRARINHILVIKRRHMRQGRIEKAGPRLMIVMLILCAVFITLFSGAAGVAFAYYQQQLPLLNGIASHTLFQTTHIYDRNGKLLYDSNDPRYGRRTYVNYNDISPNIVNATIAAED